MSDNPIDHEIGEAWKAHRQGFHDTAIQQFREILDRDPENLDALYGLGLAEKAAGNNGEAKEIFLHVQARIDGVSAEEEAAGAPGRYFMLANMVKQQINQLSQEL
ncbi:MAG: tetratricopeptide repeat protein [Chloroflexi bacterium]|nr:tetratricopeptide repeat protein [Chloroflexota bacterium]